MFEKLRWQLTKVNMIIISMLFVLLILGAYVFAENDMNHRAEVTTKMVSYDILNGIITDLPKALDFGPPPSDFLGFGPKPPEEPPLTEPRAHRPIPDLFFVKTNLAGDLIFSSQSSQLEASELNSLLQQVQQLNIAEETVFYQQKKYHFRKSELEEGGDLIVFHGFQWEHTILKGLLLGLVTAGIICVVISFFASWFLANRAMIPIKKTWQQQKEFLADASHELRTPLAIIQTNLEVLTYDKNATIASQEEWFTNIAEETTSMNRLVNSLLFLARVDANQYTLEQQPIDLIVLVERMEAVFKPIAEKKNISIVVQLKSPCTVNGDDENLKQVLKILLDNAIRHTSIGGTIAIALAQYNKNVVISVADNGEGIESDHLPHIFDRFYQVDKARAGGAGLGLAIAKWIVKNHGGDIQVVSTVRQGTTFTLKLPL